MNIKRSSLSKRIPVHEVQAKFLALCIHRLDSAFRHSFAAPYNPDVGDSDKFWALPEYKIFHDATYACGFVCADLKPDYPIDHAHESPAETLGNENFDGIRRYVHTLMRAERANQMDGYFSPVCVAIQSGSLSLVAKRIIADDSLYTKE